MAIQIKGPGIFLAQFAGDLAPFNSLENITAWAADLGYKGVQIPTFDTRLFDLDKAATSDTYCDEVLGICADAGVEITELSTHLQDNWLQLILHIMKYLMPLHHRQCTEVLPPELSGLLIN